MSSKTRRIRRLVNFGRPNTRFGFTGGFGRYAQRVGYSEEALVISLSNTLKIREQDLRWQSTWLGGFLAKFGRRTDPGSIEIDGMRLFQLFDLVGEDPDEKILVSDHYAVDLESFRSLLSQATDHVRQSVPER